MKNKTIAICSQGGHWIQLKYLLPAFENENLILISTFKKKPKTNFFYNKFYSINDASRWNKMALIKQAIYVMLIVLRERPDKIISTGASVGVWAILAGWLIKSKTIWLDSIANYSKISLSGRIVKHFASVYLTQWEHLSSEKKLYKGSII